MTTLIDLNRITYMSVGGSIKKPVLNYLSAKYKNIRFLLQARTSYLVTSSDAANLPGIAFRVYGDRDYWWVIGLYNGILSPEEDLVPGLTLQLPSLTDINAMLTSQDAQALNSITI